MKNSRFKVRLFTCLSAICLFVAGAFGVLRYHCHKQHELIEKIRVSGGTCSYSTDPSVAKMLFSRLYPQEYWGKVEAVEFARKTDPILLMGGPKKFVDPAISLLASFSSITFVGLENTQFSVTGISQLRNLESISTLNLCGTNLNHEKLSAVAEITSLKTLSLYGAKFKPGLFIRNILKKDPLRCFPCLEG